MSLIADIFQSSSTCKLTSGESNRLLPRNSSSLDTMESVCRHFPPPPQLYTLLYFHQVPRELTSGESGCSGPSSIGLSLDVLDNPPEDV